MLFHLHGVEVVESELGDTGDANGELTAEISLLGLEVDCFINLLSRENIVADRNVVDKDTFQFVRLRAQNFVLLEGLEVIHGEVADNWLVAVAMGGLFSLLESELGHGGDGLLGRGFGI